MKHAFLIVAHHEFNILSILIDLLDDARNDIYIHIDKKVLDYPKQAGKKSNVYYLEENRVDVRWGNVSQIEAEYALFETAFKNGPYGYYHMISGVHLPLVTQNEFHDFFDSVSKSQVFTPMESHPIELERKGNFKNYFMKSFSSNRFSQIGWRLGVSIQELLDLKVNKDRTFIKASNWVSLTQDAVAYMISIKKNVLKRYRYTMCGDELFVPTELTYSGKNWNTIYSERLLLHNVGRANSTVITEEELELIEKSNYLFGRKFSSSNLEIVNHIIEKVKPVL
ncbi:beta-1,6-N-acetylglucosaminyltransferase [Sphingobacterium endophyticum]|uniref:beta-1,6-N-acetylglucosaminyltransferase n=1 Tax=Sphingobacterium endophyticum TaxID=2546448 RepID=UPI0012E2B0CE|nr:beta-1,6-N-acetylglucosaminyltransferase [Sphingobacterium endophyticum]